MAAIPQPKSATVQAIYAAYEKRRSDEPARGYLGASIIGHACDRYLWLSFRWAGEEKFDGRMLRLFDRGHRAEDRFVDELRSIGARVEAVGPNGRQWAVEACGGHLRGHMDGQALGLPEAPKTRHVLEFKTHNAKSFKELQAKGVAEAKPMHVAQMQVYMLLSGLTRALYLAENKDTDELYAERIALDPEAAQKLIDRAQRIIDAAEPPLRLSDDPAYFECKWCAFHGQCHGSEAPAVTCRTCAHSTPVAGGEWHCSRHADTIPLEFQRRACAEHRYIPVLLERFAKPVDADSEANTVTYESEGGSWVNGAPPAGFSSTEIRAAKDKKALALIARDSDLQALRTQWGAEVVA